MLLLFARTRALKAEVIFLKLSADWWQPGFEPWSRAVLAPGAFGGQVLLSVFFLVLPEGHAAKGYAAARVPRPLAIPSLSFWLFLPRLPLTPQHPAPTL